MGVLGGGKTVAVSSVVYNMAGAIENRPNFLQNVILGKALDNSGYSYGEYIVSSYMNGPGIKLRNFARWAETYGYSNIVGMTPGDLHVGNSLDQDVLAGEIPVTTPGNTIVLQAAKIDIADYSYWVDQYMFENHSDLLDTDYVADFDSVTGDITITFEDTTTETFTPVGYDDTGAFLYASYFEAIPDYSNPVDTGDVIDLADGDPFPDIIGWTEDSLVTTPTDVDLLTTTETVVTYSDTTPGSSDTVVDTITDTYDEIVGVWEKTDYLGNHPTIPDATYSLRQVMNQWQTYEILEDTTVDTTVEDLGGGVSKTTVVTTTTQTLHLLRSYRLDTQELIQSSWTSAKMFIYQKGTGNLTLDAMFDPPDSFGSFFPFIPIRIDNQFISSSAWKPETYPHVVKAMKKSVKGSFDDIVADIADNPSIGNIDYAYASFGVSLNTQENSCKRYIYELFHEIIFGQSMGADVLGDWQTAYAAAHASVLAFEEWRLAQGDEGNPLNGVFPPPAIIPYPNPPEYALRVESGTRTDLNYFMQMYWRAVDESVGSGLGKPGAKRGELWFEKVGTDVYPQWIYVDGVYMPGAPLELEHLRLWWQFEDASWKRLDIYGLSHINKIYGSKIVEISAFQALDDTDESGFLVPLHQEIYKRTPIVHSTQMSTACCYLVFNCYEVNKEKWYQTAVFKILIVIAVIVITVITAGAAGPAGVGLLGANLAVGTALGAVGTAAVFVGAIANAVAAMILTQIISVVSVSAFGPKVGAIVSVVVGVLALQVGSAIASGASMATTLTNMMSVDSLMSLTSATADGYAKFVQANAQELVQQAQQIMATTQTELQEIEKKRSEMFANPNQMILDTLTLTDATVASPLETSSVFLERTLMTGMDISGISLDILSNFASITLSTELPGT